MYDKKLPKPFVVMLVTPQLFGLFSSACVYVYLWLFTARAATWYCIDIILYGCFLSSWHVSSLDSKNNGECLYTCAIRPAAIYGPGEERHLPRIITLTKLGLFPFKIGSPNVKSDWVYVDNLVLALLLASMGLLDDIPGREGHPIAAGQPYFISDGKYSLAYICCVGMWNLALDQVEV